MMKYTTIKYILRKQVESNTKTLWTYDKVKKEFTQIYRNYNDGLTIYMPKQLLNEIDNANIT